MAGVAFLYGTFNGNPVFYIGSSAADGWTYFGDKNMLRSVGSEYKIEGTDFTYVEESHQYEYSQSWTPIEGFKLKGIEFNPGNIAGGGGAEAANGDVEKAVQWAIDIANDPSHGYDQPTRDGGVDFDCSSLVSWAFRENGWGVPFPSPSTWTMQSVFTNLGFTWISPCPPVSSLLRGDILLDIDSHTAIYIGNNQIVEASINEFGETGYGPNGRGQPGDQTGQEIRVGGFWGFWDGVLRWEK